MLVLSLLLGTVQALAGTLSLSGSVDNVPLLDLPGRSCALQVVSFRSGPDDLAPVKALLGSLKLGWTGDAPVRIDSMTVEFRGPGIRDGRQEIAVDARELSYLWAGDELPAVHVPARTTISTTPFCFFMVGGVAVVDTRAYFENTGVVRVRGSYEGAAGRESVAAEMLFRYHHSPIPYRN